MLLNSLDTMIITAILDTTTTTLAAMDQSTVTNIKIKDTRKARPRIKASPHGQGRTTPYTRQGGQVLRWALVDPIPADPYSARKPWSPCKMALPLLEVAYRLARGGDTQTPLLEGAGRLAGMDGALLQWTLAVSIG